MLLPFLYSLFVLLICDIRQSFALEVNELYGANFELALSSNRYLAVLFYDGSTEGKRLEDLWTEGSSAINELPGSATIAKISSNDPDIHELIEAYGIAVPAVKVFRNGIISDYRGPDLSKGIAEFIIEDAQPSVRRITTIEEMKMAISSSLRTAVFGLFEESDLAAEDTIMDGYSFDAWGQFQASADSLRGHANFYAVCSEEIISSFKVSQDELPAVFLVSSETDGIVQYNGEILDFNLSEWVLRHSNPKMGELSVSTTAGELFATQFFSSRKLKFILFLPADVIKSTDVLQTWQDIADSFTGKAIFAFMTQPVADVLDYFNIDLEHDTPMIAAHKPTTDSRYKSALNLDVSDRNGLLEFVAGVTSGVVPRVVRSEPIPTAHKSKSNAVIGSIGDHIMDTVTVVVGSNVVETVNQADKDVLLAVYTPWCEHCKGLLPTYDVLGKAVQGEPRILIAKINAQSNDIPASWGVTTFPTLLWFPAKDKPYQSKLGATPRPYWDAGFSLHELVSFLQRQGSFDPKSLIIATTEQIGTLLGDEEIIRAKYEEEEQHAKRNQGRLIYEDATTDYYLGEIVFDGRRWHLAALGFSVALNLLLVAVIALLVRSADKIKVTAKMQKKK